VIKGPPWIAVVDVHYHEPAATAACVVLESWTAEHPVLQVTAHIDRVLPYEPGHFYRRELPCITAVLQKLPRVPDIIVVDGYAWLGELTKPGLGAHVHSALAAAVPVVGIAKTHFASGVAVREVLRGRSQRPLYVSAAGLEVDAAAEWVRGMHGGGRIPTALRLVDRLCRQGGDPSPSTADPA